MIAQKVSVVVTTYNHEKYIAQCLDGILMQQTSFPFEIILGEDESTDGTRELCQDYAKKHPDKIKLFLRSRNDVIKINGKATGRFNFIENLKACTGKYIALCEGDDYWTDPLKLQKQVDFLEANSEYGMCFHKVEVFNQEENKFEQDCITRPVLETTTINELAKGNFMHTPSVMLRNDFEIPKWFTKSPIGDWTLYMIAIKDKKIKKIDETMAVYRVHNKGIWSLKSNQQREKSTLKSIQLIYNKIEFDDVVKQTLKGRIKYYNRGSSRQSKLFYKLKTWIRN